VLLKAAVRILRKPPHDDNRIRKSSPIVTRVLIPLL